MSARIRDWIIEVLARRSRCNLRTEVGGRQEGGGKKIIPGFSDFLDPIFLTFRQLGGRSDLPKE
jgi:hypothetical protein